MGITARQQRVYDRETSIQKAHKKAVAGQKKNVQGRKAKQKAKADWVKKLKRSVRELIGGSKTYMPKKGNPKKGGY